MHRGWNIKQYKEEEGQVVLISSDINLGTTTNLRVVLTTNKNIKQALLKSETQDSELSRFFSTHLIKWGNRKHMGYSDE